MRPTMNAISVKAAIAIVAACLPFPSQASASDVNHSFCIDFDNGFMTNSCSRDLDVTWC